ESRSESAAVFSRADERLDHFRGDVVAVELIELRQPEVESRRVRIASQEPDVLHKDEHAIELGVAEASLLANLPQYGRASLGRIVQSVDERVAFRRRKAHAGVGNQRIDVLRVRHATVDRRERRARDERVEVRNLVGFENCVRARLAKDVTLADGLSVGLEVQEGWQRSERGLVSEISSATRHLEFNWQEEGRRRVDATNFTTSGIAATGVDVVHPERLACGIGRTIQEVAIQLFDE